MIPVTPPSVATNANASGIPEKFAATAENVATTVRMNPGRTFYGWPHTRSRSSRMVPHALAVTKLTLIVDPVCVDVRLVERAAANVVERRPSARLGSLNAPMTTSPAGCEEERSASYANKGSVGEPGQRGSSRLRPVRLWSARGVPLGFKPPIGSWGYWYSQILPGHSVAIFALRPWSCWASLANLHVRVGASPLVEPLSSPIVTNLLACAQILEPSRMRIAFQKE